MNVTIVSHGFSKTSIRLQPWRHIYEISKRMIERGIKVNIITDEIATYHQMETIDSIQINPVKNLISAPFMENLGSFLDGNSKTNHQKRKMR